MTASSLWRGTEPLVLASGSRFRLALLQSAGIPAEAVKPAIDERAVEASVREKGAGPEQVAGVLAEAKALSISAQYAGRFVLGCDQTLALGPKAFHKPEGRAGARQHLKSLSGRTHHLHSGLALVQDSRVIWAEVTSASMTMRELSDEMIESYLDAAGDAVLQSVGAYQLEALGIHLFEHFEGDQSTIVGLPLLPLLEALRQEGLVAR
jgi:septum formation protein